MVILLIIQLFMVIIQMLINKHNSMLLILPVQVKLDQNQEPFLEVFHHMDDSDYTKI